MKYIVNMTDPRGVSKIKYVEAHSVKEAEAKAIKKYPSYDITRIAAQKEGIDYYSLMKNLKE